MRLGLIILAGVLAVLAPPSVSADELTGTLKKIRDSRAITLGVRESSPPFSFLNPGGRAGRLLGRSLPGDRRGGDLRTGHRADRDPPTRR